MTLQEILALLGKGAAGIGGTLATAGLGTGNLPVAAGGAGLAGLGALLSAYNAPEGESPLTGAAQTLFGIPEQQTQYPRYTQPQMQFIESLLPLLSQELGEGQTLDFGPIAEQAQRRFEQRTVPGLAERFTAMTGGRASSPSFAAQLGQAGGELQSDLAAQQARYGLQAQQLKNQRLSTLLGGALQPAYAAENIIRRAEPGAINPQSLQALGSYITKYLQGAQ